MDRRTSWLFAAIAGGGVLVIIVVALAGGVIVGAGRSGPPASGSAPSPRPIPPATAVPPHERASVETAVELTAGKPEIRLVVSAQPDFPSPEPAIGNLADGQVVIVNASGFAPDSYGRLAQCQRQGGVLKG